MRRPSDQFLRGIRSVCRVTCGHCCTPRGASHQFSGVVPTYKPVFSCLLAKRQYAKTPLACLYALLIWLTDKMPISESIFVLWPFLRSCFSSLHYVFGQEYYRLLRPNCIRGETYPSDLVPAQSTILWRIRRIRGMQN